MNETEVTKLLKLCDSHARATKRLNKSLDALLPNGCRIEIMDHAEVWKYESARQQLETIGLPWIVIGRSIDDTHVSVQRVDGTRSIHEIRRVVETVRCGLCRIVK